MNLRRIRWLSQAFKVCDNERGKKIKLLMSCPRVNFIKILREAFTRADPKSAKRYRWLEWIFTLLGSLCVKAARKTFWWNWPQFSQATTTITPFSLYSRKRCTIILGEGFTLWTVYLTHQNFSSVRQNLKIPYKLC
jgi:hypothetical protein